MIKEKAFLEDVGIKDLPFPMKIISRLNPDGKQTIANIFINARIIQEFEAEWIDKFIRILHSHRDKLGIITLTENIYDYLKELNASISAPKKACGFRSAVSMMRCIPEKLRFVGYKD